MCVYLFLSKLCDLFAFTSVARAAAAVIPNEILAAQVVFGRICIK